MINLYYWLWRLVTICSGSMWRHGRFTITEWCLSLLAPIGAYATITLKRVRITLERVTIKSIFIWCKRNNNMNKFTNSRILFVCLFVCSDDFLSWELQQCVINTKLTTANLSYTRNWFNVYFYDLNKSDTNTKLATAIPHTNIRLMFLIMNCTN